MPTISVHSSQRSRFLPSQLDPVYGVLARRDLALETVYLVQLLADIRLGSWTSKSTWAASCHWERVVAKRR
ncbi:hypothetical protein NBRC116597_02840 [Phaeobacter sp. NW0010-22]